MQAVHAHCSTHMQTVHTASHNNDKLAGNFTSYRCLVLLCDNIFWAYYRSQQIIYTYIHTHEKHALTSSSSRQLNYTLQSVLLLGRRICCFNTSRGHALTACCGRIPTQKFPTVFVSSRQFTSQIRKHSAFVGYLLQIGVRSAKKRCIVVCRGNSYGHRKCYLGKSAYRSYMHTRKFHDKTLQRRVSVVTILLHSTFLCEGK